MVAVGSEVVTIVIPAPSLKNNLINQEAENLIAVYLPPNYEIKDKNYPVIYYLPGYNDGSLTYANVFKEALNNMIAEGKAEEMIVVAINGMNTIGGSFYMNSPVSGNWKTM